jgi:hypothetical protein
MLLQGKPLDDSTRLVAFLFLIENYNFKKFLQIGNLMQNLNIKNLANLGSCWCCGNSEGLHEHHIIPQAYGGKNGPLVTLCGACHTNVHNTANEHIRKNTDIKSLTPNTLTSTLSKTMLLCVYIVKSHALIAKSKARQARKVTVNLTPLQSEQLDMLQTTLQCSSQEKVFKLLLEQATANMVETRNK